MTKCRWTFVLAILVFSNMPYSFQLTTTSYSVLSSTQQTCRLWLRRTASSECDVFSNEKSCVLEEMFSALQFRDGDDDNCISDSLKISIFPWMSPSLLTRDFISTIDTCNQSLQMPVVSVHYTNPCGPVVCCVKCSTCFKKSHDILSEAGPMILGDNITNINPGYGPTQLHIMCYLDSFIPIVGEQYVFVSFEYNDECVDKRDGSTVTSPEVNKTQSSTIDMQNKYTAVASGGLSDSVALALVFTFTGLAAIIIICIGLNFILAKTKQATGETA